MNMAALIHRNQELRKRNANWTNMDTTVKKQPTNAHGIC